MRQSPLPTTTDTLRVPLPDAFERWRDLHFTDAGQKLVGLAVFALFVYLLVRITRRFLEHNIEDVGRRHVLRKWVGYGYTAALLLFGVALFAESLAGFGTVVAVLLAGIAVALQDVVKSFVGWLFISGRSGIDIGSRVEVDGVLGDVVDIGVLKTTLLEVGNLVYGRQSTGRLVSIPNHKVLSEPVLISAAVNPFVWQEVRITVTYESDWERAEAILREVGEEIYREVEPELARGFREMERRYAFRYGKRTPIVYVSLAPSGVDLTLRYLIHDRRRRGSIDRVSRRVLQTVAAEPRVNLAYPTQRVVGEGPPVFPPPLD